jgi:uncharacterized protein YdeI (YjbR/CyaY-like superfamily)
MVKTENFVKVEVSSVSELRNWLTINHTQKESVWLVTFKKQIPDKYVSIPEVLDELLCFGWIDGIRRKLDETRTMQLISSRQVQHWTKTYKDRFQKLDREGRMTDAGRDAVLLSKKNGLWDFMEDVDKLIKPKDFLNSLEENPPALQNFDGFGNSSKRFMLRYIKIAKTPETRAKRINHITTLAKQNIKLPGS